MCVAVSEGGRGEFLNAEGAKVSQRTQKGRKKTKGGNKKKKKENLKLKKLSSNRRSKIEFFVLLLHFLFCALCEIFAPSAFKKSPFSLRSLPAYSD
jgi:transposase